MRLGSGDVVVVTGGSAGIGRAVVRRLAERGCSVAVLARGRQGLDATVKDVEAAGGTALAIQVDVADERALDAAAEQVEETLGPIDVWINNAFTTVFGAFTDVSAEEFRRVNEVVYFGYVNGTRSALERMLPRDRGTVVQVGSALAYRGIPLQAAYCGAKHAVQGFTESLRCELMARGSGIRLTMVALPAVNTPQFSWCRSRLDDHPQPVPPIYQPEVAADAIVFAAEHPRRREYWVGAPTVGTMIANAVVPGLLDRYLARTGLSAQQTDEVPNPPRPDNLFEPVDGDQGAHGEFDFKAKPSSTQLRLAQAAALAIDLAFGGARAATAALTALARQSRPT